MSADKIFKYNELEAALDVSDFTVLERIDNAFQRLDDFQERLKAADNTITKLKTMFYTYTQLLEEITNDPDAANKALGGSSSVDEVTTVLFALIDFLQKQDAAIADRWTKLTKKYMPLKK